MDTLRGQFDPADFSEDLHDYDFAEEDGLPEPPPSPIGQDERRMQVRAYNHWAGQLGDSNFPNIEDLHPEALDDFGPYSVLLGFTGDIEDPDVCFVGGELAQECDTDAGIAKLSDVPSRSLLSRITDHYMQILANQAPIGFEAEFVNQRSQTILYRGILLPYSSDNESIDYIYGVINWKEMADQQTTDELMLEIDQALEGEEIASIDADDETNVLDLSSFQPAEENDVETSGESAEEKTEEPAMPKPTFGSLLTPEGYEDDDDDESMLPADWSLSDPTAETDGDYADDSADVYDEDFDHEGAEDHEGESNELGLGRLIESEFERAERKPIDLSALDIDGDAIDPEEPGADAIEHAQEELAEEQLEEAIDAALDGAAEEPAVDEDIIAARMDEIGEGFSHEGFDENEFIENETMPDYEETAAPLFEEPASIEEQISAPFEVEGGTAGTEAVSYESGDAVDAHGLRDSLADARELAQAASQSEERSRHALYAAVARAYDVSIAAQDAPEQFGELLEENGLTMQDRAPMTPVVKLVFGADYDKTRLTEYAAVLSHAHRVGIERGKLGTFLAEADGGLKGVVQEERRIRREESGKPAASRDAVRKSLAKKLRGIDGIDLADIPVEGSEFGVVMIQRTADGEIVVLGEVTDDIPLIERVGRKIIG